MNVRIRLSALLVIPVIACITQIGLGERFERRIEELVCTKCGTTGTRLLPTAYGFVELPPAVRARESDCSGFLRRHYGVECRTHEWRFHRRCHAPGEPIFSPKVVPFRSLADRWSEERRYLFEKWADDSPHDLRIWIAYVLDPTGACPGYGHGGGCHGDYWELMMSLSYLEMRYAEAKRIGCRLEEPFLTALPRRLAMVWNSKPRHVVNSR